jgi:hypothetical protein
MNQTQINQPDSAKRQIGYLPKTNCKLFTPSKASILESTAEAVAVGNIAGNLTIALPPWNFTTASGPRPGEDFKIARSLAMSMDSSNRAGMRD